MKEQEMLDDLMPVCHKGFSSSVRIQLPSDLPDIDLLLADEDSQAVIVAELKWLRKPSFEWKERIHRKGDFEKGLRQLSDVRAFLTQHPEFLDARGKLRRPLNEYQHLAFVFIARDYFLWPDREAIIVADYKILKETLGQTSSLRSLVGKLKTYDWLPAEGKDFRVVFEPPKTALLVQALKTLGEKRIDDSVIDTLRAKFNMARRPERDRAQLFRATAQAMRVHEAIVEKDFWVCWILDYLFQDSP